MMQFVRKKRRSPVINIISMIDILVVLLIFYIVTTVFKKDQPIVKIVVPKSSQAGETKDAPPEIIYLTKEGQLYFDDQPVDAKKLTATLKEKLLINPNFKVALKADTGTTFGDLVKVEDAAHDAGITDLSTFMNRPDNAAPEGTNP